MTSSLVKEMTKIRNGFDHAWTAQAGVQPDIEAAGRRHLKLLDDLIARMIAQKLLA